jgi:hypothetical protein
MKYVSHDGRFSVFAMLDKSLPVLLTLKIVKIVYFYLHYRKQKIFGLVLRAVREAIGEEFINAYL